MNRQNDMATMDNADFVIVGNGIAGLTAAVEIRRLEPEKRIVIMTRQSHPTINTPALKQFAVGKLAREQLLAYPSGTERLQRIHVVSATVDEIRTQGNYICLAGGQGFGYGSLLLATGSSPSGLPATMPGRDFDGVLTLHRLDDYLDLRRRLNEVEEVVVVGGGVHAVETVMGMLYLGIRVSWLIRSETFMANTLDPAASEMVLEGIRRAGAKIYTGTEVIGIVGRVGVVAGVVTTRQQMLPCQLVLMCTGTSPVTALAKNCDAPMKHKNGILVDDQLRTSVRNVYAAGDVAALRDPLTGKYAPRAQWYAAVLQGRVVASAMTGAGEAESFGVSWHATRLGDLSMLTVGNPLDSSGTITPLTQKRKGSYYRLALAGDRLVGYFALGAKQPDSLAIKRLIDEGLSVREIKKDLLRGEFDSRKYFSGKRTYAVQRMMTTGQLPTPLPPVPGLIGGERRSGPRISGQGELVSPAPAQPGLSPFTGEIPALPTTGPLVSASGSGDGQLVRKSGVPQPTTPVANDQRRRQIAAQMTITGIVPAVLPESVSPRPNAAQPPGLRVSGPPVKQDASWLTAGPPEALQGSSGAPSQPLPLQGGQAPASPPQRQPAQRGPASPPQQQPAQRGPVAPPPQQPPAQRGPVAPPPQQSPARGSGFLKKPLHVSTPAATGNAGQSAPPAPNPHPTRSIWHYTDKHPAIKRKGNV